MQQLVRVGIPSEGLSRHVDPGMMTTRVDDTDFLLIPKGLSAEKVQQIPRAQIQGLRVATGVLVGEREIRTAPGRIARFGNTIYTGGTSGTITIYARRAPSFLFGNVLVAVRQERLTGTATATTAGRLVDSTSPFRPSHVGRVVRNTTASLQTVITGFLNPDEVEVADDVFESGDEYWIAIRSDVVGMAPYISDGYIPLNDSTVLGELNDDDAVDIVQFQNRAFIISANNRGAILYKNQFRALGLRECRDNNTLVVSVSAAGAVTGKYKWALCFEDSDSFRTSPPLAIENAGDYYTLAGKRLNLSSLPTNTIDTWTHFVLFRRKDEWDQWYQVARVAKATGAIEDNVVDGVALASNTLNPYRYMAAGWRRMFTCRNRAFFYGGNRLEIHGALSATKDSDVVTLSAPYTAEDWMVGKDIQIGKEATVSYQIRAMMGDHELQLVVAWDGETVLTQDGVIGTDQNRLAWTFDSYGDAEMVSPYYFVDVNPDDGDEIMHCAPVQDYPIVLKRRGVYLVRIGQIVDPVGCEVPDVDVSVLDLQCPLGCVGPWAAAMDTRGWLFWFSGQTGVMVFDGSSFRCASEAIRDRLLELDPEQFYSARMVHDPTANEMYLGNLMDLAGLSVGLVLNLDTGRWRELADLEIRASCAAMVK